MQHRALRNLWIKSDKSSRPRQGQGRVTTQISSFQHELRGKFIERKGTSAFDYTNI